MAAERTSAESLPGSTVLVVDDEFMTLNFCCLVLREHGYQVCSASCGKQALQFFESGQSTSVSRCWMS